MLTATHRYQTLSPLLSGVTLYGYNHFSEDITRCAFSLPWETGLFLGHWDLDTLFQDLNDFGFLQKWKSQGHEKIWLEIAPETEKGLSELSVWTEYDAHSELLMHLIVWLEFTRISATGDVYSSLSVEHLRLQNPSSDNMALLPGQDFPPSGLMFNAFHFIRHLASVLGTEIITEIPEYFHTACLFQKCFTYIDPKMQALFEEFQKQYLDDQKSMNDIRKISKDFEEGKIIRDGKPYYWPTEMQFFTEDAGIRKKILNF